MSSRRYRPPPPKAIDCRPNPTSCRVGRSGFALRSLSAIVTHYKATYLENADDEVGHYAELPTLPEAIRVAGFAMRRDGKRHAHQRRLPPHVLTSCARSLDAVRR